ncbi:MAG TPA: discoidin domain-containing protein, partial [Bacteroidales bacterium]|nr:discoidin domain-containing protein [Bacteroidales bacterium]
MRKATTTKFNLLAVIAVFLSFNAFAQTTSLVSIDGSGHMTYSPDAKGNVLPDFSYVGYHHGEKPIPDVRVIKTISPKAGDNLAHIQDAIDYVADQPADENGHKGALLLNAGLYEVSGTIQMRSGVVLRGEGTNTIIRAVFTSRDPLISVNSGDSPGHSLIGSTRKKLIDDYVPFGARTFRIESGHSFNVGDRVVLQRRPTQQWIDDLNVAQYGWTTGGYTIDFFRVIEAVDGNTITIDAPVVDHIYSGIADGFLYKYENSSDYKTEIGIEDMRLETAYKDEHDRDHSHDAIKVHTAENGWIRNIDTYHFTYSTVSFSTGAYKWTVENCRYLRPVGTLNSGTRYAFNIGDGHQILFQNCFSYFGRHDFATGSRVTGPNVFSNCKAMNCWNVSGPHHRWATGILYDRVSTDLDLNVENRTNSGSGHGWAGANHVMWNSSTYSRMVIHDMPTDANNWAIGCIAGEGITGVGRRSTDPLGLVESEGTHIADIPILYRAQLDDRLGAGTASTDDPFPGFTGDQTVYPDELTITSAVAGNEAGHHGITRIAEDSYDGDLHTRWASETDLSDAWIEYTLDGTYEIYQIKLQLFNTWIRRYPIRIVVDGATVFNGVSQLTEEMEWNSFSFSPVSGSKVKIFLTAKNSFDNADLAIHETKILGSTESLATHALAVSSGTGAGSYVAGSDVPVRAAGAPAGQEFDQWTGDISTVEDIYSSSTTVNMPDSDVQLTATYHNYYNVTVNSGIGDGSFTPRTTVVITAD